MEVKIKDFGLSLEVKNTGMELQIRDNNGSHLGDLVINKRRMEWCPGKTTRGRGKKIGWVRLIELFNVEGHD